MQLSMKLHYHPVSISRRDIAKLDIDGDMALLPPGWCCIHGQAMVTNTTECTTERLG